MNKLFEMFKQSLKYLIETESGEFLPTRDKIRLLRSPYWSGPAGHR